VREERLAVVKGIVDAVEAGAALGLPQLPHLKETGLEMAREERLLDAMSWISKLMTKLFWRDITSSMARLYLCTEAGLVAALDKAW
jgi:hypothetical protein